MRAGRLDRRISIEHGSEAKDSLGVVSTTWAPIATTWAEVVQGSTSEFLNGAGLQGDAAVVFRIRWLAGVTVRDRVVYGGVAHDIKEIKELGRRRGIELRTVARSAQ